MAKRARRELARLNEQTQFSLAWPDVPPAAEQSLVEAVRTLGVAARKGGGERGLAGLVLGVNAVTRALERRIGEGERRESGGGSGGGVEIALLVIARHARQAFVQHIPILALQAGPACADSVDLRPASSSLVAASVHPPSTTFRMVKVCGVPFTSSKLGEIFGVGSVAALAIFAGEHLSTPALAGVLAAARDEHALTPSCFRNLDATAILVRRGQDDKLDAPDGDEAGRSGGSRRRRRRAKKRRKS